MRQKNIVKMRCWINPGLIPLTRFCHITNAGNAAESDKYSAPDLSQTRNHEVRRSVHITVTPRKKWLTKTGKTNGMDAHYLKRHQSAKVTVQ